MRRSWTACGSAFYTDHEARAFGGSRKVQRKLGFSLALVGPLTAVLLAPSSGGQRASTDRPAASATPAGVRPAADVSGRRVVARPSVQSGPELVSTTQPRGYYFGWFGLFMAFTGRDIVGMLHLALAALCVGVGSMVAARRVLRPA